MCFGSLHIMLNTHLGILTITKTLLFNVCHAVSMCIITLKRPACYFTAHWMLFIPLVDPVAVGLMVSVNMLFSVMTHISSQSQFSQHPATQLPGPFPISSVQHQHLAQIYTSN